MHLTVCLVRSEVCYLQPTFTHDQQWESNPRHSDLVSSALFTSPRAPNTIKLRNIIIGFYETL